MKTGINTKAANSTKSRYLFKDRHYSRFGMVCAAIAAFIALYKLIEPMANWVTYSVLHMKTGSYLGESIVLLLSEIPRTLLLFSGLTFLVAFVSTFFKMDRIHDALCGKSRGFGHLLAAVLGMFTPLCSCSAIPLFVGFIGSGIPLGIGITFLVASPMINVVAIFMLTSLLGWKVAGLYVLSGLIIAMLSGVLVGRFESKHHLGESVLAMEDISFLTKKDFSWPDRLQHALLSARKIAAAIWPHVLIGVVIGVAIRGYLSAEALVSIESRLASWSVPIAVALGIPIYSNVAGVTPIVSALIARGVSSGTVLAFMMSTIVLSLPELVVLYRVLKARLLAVFVGTVVSAIVLCGYLFDLLL